MRLKLLMRRRLRAKSMRSIQYRLTFSRIFLRMWRRSTCAKTRTATTAMRARLTRATRQRGASTHHKPARVKMVIAAPRATSARVPHARQAASKTATTAMRARATRAIPRPGVRTPRTGCATTTLTASHCRRSGQSRVGWK